MQSDARASTWPILIKPDKISHKACCPFIECAEAVAWEVVQHASWCVIQSTCLPRMTKCISVTEWSDIFPQRYFFKGNFL